VFSLAAITPVSWGQRRKISPTPCSLVIDYQHLGEIFLLCPQDTGVIAARENTAVEAGDIFHASLSHRETKIVPYIRIFKCLHI
jgi:hypothetical protein